MVIFGGDCIRFLVWKGQFSRAVNSNPRIVTWVCVQRKGEEEEREGLGQSHTNTISNSHNIDCFIESLRLHIWVKDSFCYNDYDSNLEIFGKYQYSRPTRTPNKT